MERNWTTLEIAPPSLSLFGSTDPDGNSFNRGTSQLKKGLGPGLLGDVRSHLNGQPCADCPPSAPCPNCIDDRENFDTGSSAGAGAGAGAQGQIIKTQVPIPAPGLFPPPIVTTPSQPGPSPIIGDPNAFWNRPLDELFSWASRPTEEQRAQCQDEYDTDMIDCKTVYAVKGSRHGKACEQRAFDKYVDCVHNDGQKGIQPYWRQRP
ncbi:MAG TPA: hypothetical protein VGM25_02135 [Caulobacteraceae bacterium]|jgi:hypothetical protein